MRAPLSALVTRGVSAQNVSARLVADAVASECQRVAKIIATHVGDSVAGNLQKPATERRELQRAIAERVLDEIRDRLETDLREAVTVAAKVVQGKLIGHNSRTHLRRAKRIAEDLAVERFPPLRGREPGSKMTDPQMHNLHALRVTRSREEHSQPGHHCHCYSITAENLKIGKNGANTLRSQDQKLLRLTGSQDQHDRELDDFGRPMRLDKLIAS